MARLRLVLMGTPEFALPVLTALLEAGHEMVRVYSRAPKPAGRGGQPRLTPVHAAAIGHGIAVETPANFKLEAAQHSFAALEADAAVGAAYGLILPPPVLAAPRFGCLNVHASLLPRWRGAAPIQRAIMAGEAMTGVCVMRMDEGLDTGPVLLAEEIPIGPRSTAGELHDELARRGARLMATALDGLAVGHLEATPQAAEGASYAAKLTVKEERLDWRRPAAELERLVRALAPAPGAWFTIAGERIKVREAELVADGAGVPATVLDAALVVACGSGALRLLRLQRAGRRVMAADAFLRGFPIAPGTRLAVA